MAVIRDILTNGLHEVLDSGRMEPETLKALERYIVLMDLEADMQEPEGGDGPCAKTSSPMSPR